MARKALISVYNKAGLGEFALGLKELSWEIISTGGTARYLKDMGIEVKEVSQVTGFPEILDGRVKTLHPRIHGAILARRGVDKDMAQLSQHQIETIDMVVVNLYPFVETCMKDAVTLDEIVEQIDIGGPALLRAAAKNWASVIVVSDPSQYTQVLDALKSTGDLDREARLKLAYQAFSHTASYDSAISAYLGMLVGNWPLDFPNELTIGFRKSLSLRYGENPHQKAAYYEPIIPRISSRKCPDDSTSWSLSRAQLHGNELSYNNIGDIDAALSTVSEFTGCAAAVIKHASPCGVALGRDAKEAFSRAFEGDPVSGFGGVVALNREVDAACAEAMSKIFLEVVVAPSFTQEALEILSRKKNLKILAFPPYKRRGFSLKSAGSGALLQEEDLLSPDDEEWKVVSRRVPSEAEMQDLRFAMAVCKHVKSNAIVLARDKATCGIGGGQPNRVDAVRISVQRAGERARGSVMASDAFFPFPDSVEEAAKAGITAICHPGGSIRDGEVLERADELGVAIVITGRRHFLH